jgi:hypothetical protein
VYSQQYDLGQTVRRLADNNAIWQRANIVSNRTDIRYHGIAAVPKRLLNILVGIAVVTPGAQRGGGQAGLLQTASMAHARLETAADGSSHPTFDVVFSLSHCRGFNHCLLV